MKISFDPAKRDATLADRGLDFGEAAQVYDGPFFFQEDDRFAYPEPRFQTYGYLNGRMVTFIWTPTDDGFRVISMRHCHDKEERSFRPRLG